MSREDACPSIAGENGTSLSLASESKTECCVSPLSDTAASPPSPPTQPTSVHDCPPMDTTSLSTQVRHYLKANQIHWSKFSTLVLGVTQSRLSTLLSRPRPWHLLSRRVQGLYQRMKLWMDTRATFGNNPYLTEEKPNGQKSRESRGRPGRKTSGWRKKPRSLFDLEENNNFTSEKMNHEVFLVGAKVEDPKEEGMVVDPLCTEQSEKRVWKSEITSAGIILRRTPQM
eukprot:GFUD01037777.1.p1 GENE.GFUD01037777.1~~GFUD01037777.1.p1  ORF type:complete len:228 (+),score=68.17 GFUD01037777.1:96-779(+)